MDQATHTTAPSTDRVKTCFKCGETLPMDEFYRHPRMSDGHLGKCKRCTRKYSHEHRVINRERYREQDRQRLTKERIEKMLGAVPERVRRARFALHNAVARGIIAKPDTCQECGKVAHSKGGIHAHHTDYSKPLEVMWVCPQCHGRLHRIDSY